jgi:hypothetical protein
MRAAMAVLAVLVGVYPALAVADTPTPPPDWTAAMRAQTLTGAEDALTRYFFINRVPKIKAAIAANRAKLMAITDPDQFATAFTKVLYDTSHDPHLAVSYSSDAVPQPRQHGKPSPLALAYRQHMDEEQDYGFSTCARLFGNIGYVRLIDFGPLSGTKALYDSAMTLLSNTDGLIIDLMGNGGGAAASVDYLLGYFLPKSVEVTGFEMRNGNAITHRRMYTPAVLGAPRYDKPVYVLINRYTFSGAEQFAYDLKALHRATLIGETTAGGANPGGDVWLSDHFSIFIPTGTALNPYTGTNWDGTGVAPDIVFAGPAGDKAEIEAYTLALKSAKNSFPGAVDDRNFVLQDPAKAWGIAFPQLPPHE